MHEPLNLRPPNSGRSARQLYVTLQKAIENGEMGTREFAQEILEFAVILARRGTLEKGPAFEVFVSSDSESLGFVPTWPPGKVIIKEVKRLSWAERKGVTVGCEVVAVNDKLVESMDKRKFADLLKNTRPLRISLYAPLEEFKAALHQYAGVLLDALAAYKSPTLDIWIVEALTNVHRFVEGHRDQLAVPLFDSFSEVALRNAFLDEEPQFHDRLLVGLGSMMNPECRFTTALIDYILNQMESRSGRLAPVTMEHALALLGCAQSAHRLHHQVRLTMEASRGFSSEVSLATRTLLTLAELYDLAAHRAAQPKDDWYSQTFGGGDSDQLDAESVYNDGVPTDGSDVRLAVTLLDLHKENRKVAGAAARALAIMCKLTRDHLAAVLVDEPRGLLHAQQLHKSSRAVNHHVAEIVLLAAKQPGRSLITENTLLLAARAVRACAQDSFVVTTGLNALLLTANKGEHDNAIMESIPPTELVRIGEAHAANVELMVLLCELLLWQLSRRPSLRDEFVRSGLIAVPFRVIECAVKTAQLEDVTDDAAIALAVLAGTLVLRLTFGNEDAVHHAAKIDGASALLRLLEIHEGNATATHIALMALKSITHSQAARRMVIRYEDPATWSVLDDVLRYAEASASQDPDILAQACCALSTLTTVEGHEPSEDDMRVEINQDVLHKIIADTQWNFPAFPADENYCLRLIAVAATEQHDQRLLDEQGYEIFVIAKGDLTRVAAWAEPMEEDEEHEFYTELGPSTAPEAQKIRGLRGRVKMADMEVQTDPIELHSIADESTAASTAPERQPRRPSDLSSDRPSTPLGEASGWMADLFGDEYSDAEADEAGAAEDFDLEKEMNRMMGLEEEDDEEAEEEKLEKLPRRRRRHHMAHGFKGKSVKKLGTGREDAGGGIFGGMFGGAGDASEDPENKEEDDEDKADGATEDKAEDPNNDKAEGAAADGGYLGGFGGFGVSGFFGAQESAQDGAGKASTAAKKGDTEGEDEGDEGEEGEGDEDEDQPDEGLGFGDDYEDEEEAEERRKKEEEEKKKKEEEEAAKKRGRFGGLFG